jgi:DNA-binding response OmpR family regulator
MNKSQLIKCRVTSPSVLIIEDDPAMLRGLNDNFCAHGYRVTTVTDGRAGLAAALFESPDLIVLDLMLPGMNGYEICRQLRQRECRATIIMVTAKGQEEDVVRGLELGADDYVTKPFSIRELLARANAFMRRRRQPVTTRMKFGEFVLDTQAHTLHCKGERLELTRKEYQLLEYLLTHAGRALSRNEILNAVWGHHVIVTPRSVDRCVATLRAKIEANPGPRPLIHTIRDVGYRFDLDALDDGDGAH